MSLSESEPSGSGPVTIQQEAAERIRWTRRLLCREAVEKLKSEGRTVLQVAEELGTSKAALERVRSVDPEPHSLFPRRAFSLEVTIALLRLAGMQTDFRAAVRSYLEEAFVRAKPEALYAMQALEDAAPSAASKVWDRLIDEAVTERGIDITT